MHGARPTACRRWNKVVLRVIDSSVILAVMKRESGADRGSELAQQASISAASVAEVVTKCIEWNVPEAVALDIIGGCGMQIIPLDESLAVVAGQLRRKAPRGVLSLGDRACIATAMNLGATAITADRIWATLNLPCPVELIR